MSRLPQALAELGRVLRVLPTVEWGRRHRGPARLLRSLRQLGRKQAPRSLEQRQRLRRVIGLVDRRFPDGGNCFRRVLLEVALDPVSAAEPVHLALREHGGVGSGHAWLGAVPDTQDVYDAVFVA
jgi:hypothetical protein